MLEILLSVLLGLAALVAVVLAIAARRPDHFRIERSRSIAAQPASVFPLIDDLESMNSWNPFDKQDPNIKGTYSGPAAGRGARYTFDSRKAGTGFIEIVESRPVESVVMRLVMTRPFACDNRIEFKLVPEGDGGTRVSWAMEGGVPLLMRVMHMVLSMDRMVGGQFDRGLADLKAIAERGQG